MAASEITHFNHKTTPGYTERETKGERERERERESKTKKHNFLFFSPRLQTVFKIIFVSKYLGSLDSDTTLKI